jgi:hypothetical protein
MERLTSTALREVLDKVGPSVADGCVNVVSVEAIRERSGERWARKGEQVAAFIERTFARLAQPGDLLVGLSDVEFVAIQPGASRFTALGVSAKTLKETLVFFLGAAARDDLRLFQVTSFAGGALELEPVNAALAMQAGDDLDRVRVEALPPERADGGGPILDDLDWTVTRRWRLTSPPNLTLELAITPEPTWNIGARVVASYLLRPSMWLAVGDERPRPVGCRDLPAQLAAEVALSTVTYATNLLGECEVQVALHAPLALHAITYSGSRYRLLNALRALPPSVRRFLVLEVTELAGGCPPGRISEVVSMVSPYCRAVLARAPSETTDVRAWRGSGLNGVTLDCSGLDPADRAAQHRLAVFARRAAEAAFASVGHGLPSSSLMLAAWAGGFTHLGGFTLPGTAAVPKVMRRVEPWDLFASPCDTGDEPASGANAA